MGYLAQAGFTTQETPAYSKNSYRANHGAAAGGDRASVVTSSSSYITPRLTGAAEDKRGHEAAREATANNKGEDRASVLKAYRRSRGLCFICGEKWAPGHKCGTSVQLHVVQELLDTMGFDSVDEEDKENIAPMEACAISVAALKGTEAPNTFRMLGQIQKHKVLMLVDSGSSHCFVNEHIAAQLKGTERSIPPVQVKIADGGILTCDNELVNCEWWCQGTTFCSNLKVLPLGGYDVIIGMDWLQSHTPMRVDWLGKRMAFWADGKMVMLLESNPSLALANKWIRRF